MQFLFSTLLATAATLASIASAAPSLLPREEVAVELPARFALYVASDLAWANGQRLRWTNDLTIIQHGDPFAYFNGGNGKIWLDRSVHQLDPRFPGPWVLGVHNGVDTLMILPTKSKDGIIFEPGVVALFVTGKFVQTTSGMLRLVRAGGVLQNGVKLCGGPRQPGESIGPIGIWWDNAPYIDCPVVQLRVQPL